MLEKKRKTTVNETSDVENVVNSMQRGRKKWKQKPVNVDIMLSPVVTGEYSGVNSSGAAALVNFATNSVSIDIILLDVEMQSRVEMLRFCKSGTSTC